MKKQLEKKKIKRSKKLWEQLQPSVMCCLLGLCFSKQSLCLPCPRLMTHHLAFCNAFRLFSSQSFFLFYFILIRKSFFCLLLLFVYLLDVAIVWMCFYLREDTKLMSEMRAGCKLDLGILYFFAYWIFCLTSRLIILVFAYVTIPPNYPITTASLFAITKGCLATVFFSVFQRQISLCSFGIILMQLVSSEIHMQWWNLLPGKTSAFNH